MDIEYEIRDGTLIFKDLQVGNLITGEPLDWDTLRRVVIIATRFGTNRPIKGRSLKELTEDVQKFIDKRKTIESKQDQEIHNLRVLFAACQEYINRQNIEINEWRTRYVEAARALQKLKEEARS
jgi:hypothetical protein